MGRLKERTKKAYERIPQKYRDDAKEVVKETYKFAKTAAIVKVIARLSEYKS